MFLLKLIRKMGKLVRGGVASRQIFLGALLGVLIGMIPGFNLSVIIVALILLVFNAHVGIALIGFALGKLAMYLLAPVTFQVGYFLIHSIGLEGIFRTLANTTGLALLDLHIYSLLGGIPFAIVIGIVFAGIMNRIVQSLRKGIVEATEHSEKMKKLAANKLVRLFMWLVFGKKKEDIQDMLQKRPSLFRKAGLGLAAALLIIGVAVELLFLDYFLATGLKKGLEAANGAEVNFAEADLSLSGGRVAIKGLQITDPAKPTHNSFTAEGLTADLSLKDLLRKRYVIDLLAVHNVTFDQRRTSPGQVFVGPPEKPAEKGKNAINYLEKARTLREYLARFQNYLEKIKNRTQKKEKLRKIHKSGLIDTARSQGYLALSAKNLLAEHPAWIIRRAEVDGVVVPGLAGPRYIQGSNMSSHPELGDGTMALIMAAGPEDQPAGALKFNFHDPAAPHELALKLRGLEMGKGNFLSDDAPVTVQQGKADLELKGKFSSDGLDLPFTVVLTELEARSREGEPVLGLDPETAGKVFESIDSFNLVGRVTGSPASPRLKLDIGETTASLKNGLVAAGRERLMQEAEKQVEKATGKLKEKAGRKIKEQAGRLLGGGKKNKGGKQDSTVETIKDLF